MLSPCLQYDAWRGNAGGNVGGKNLENLFAGVVKPVRAGLHTDNNHGTPGGVITEHVSLVGSYSLWRTNGRTH